MSVSSEGGGGRSSEEERLLISESDIIQLLLEYLAQRNLTSSQLELEKESGLVNEIISPDLLFLRNLIIEGRYDDVFEFLQPLEEAFSRSFPGKKVKQTILKHRFLDMLCTHIDNSHSSTLLPDENKTSSVFEQIVKVLNQLETLCDKDEYQSLCILLTSPHRIAEHPEYKDWKSSSARLACFKSLRPLVSRFIPTSNSSGTKQPTKLSKGDRLIQLLIKGILYETCVDYCQTMSSKTMSSSNSNDNNGKGSLGKNSVSSFKAPDNLLKFSQLLNESHLSESDLSLLSWFRSIPSSTFGCPFQRRGLRIDVEPMPKPQKVLMNVSIMDSASDLLSRSLLASTSFHLSSTDPQQPSSDSKNIMTASVDRLFEDLGDSIHQANGNDSEKNKSGDPGKTNYPNNNPSNNDNMLQNFSNDINTRAKFLPVTLLEDVQAIRCADFHPSGKVYAIGSNSKTLRVCAYPTNLSELTENHVSYQPTVLFKRTKHHKGSIYCLGWSPDESMSLLATGSNDKTVKLLRFEDVTNSNEIVGSQEIELNVHDGTVRDICWIEETNKKSSLLVSGGAGDQKIYVTDVTTATPFQAISGHSGPILSLYNWGGQIFCSGSQDKSIKFWDLRTRGCIDTFIPITCANISSPITSLCVEPSARLLVAGHENSSITLFDIRGKRQIQAIKTHSEDVRSVRFSPAAYYLLSTGYDNNIVLTDLQGDLSFQLPSVVVASHQDKVISGRWHPSEFTFLSTSADKTIVLWALPPEP